MKTYINLGLSIGLLSFNPLSSCVSIKQGMNEQESLDTSLAQKAASSPAMEKGSDLLLDQKTALGEAIVQGSEPMVRILIPNEMTDLTSAGIKEGQKVPAVYAALACKQPGIAKILLTESRGRELNLGYRDSEGRDSFYLAAEYGYLDVVEGFLDPKNNHNVDVNTKDAAGNTALGTAALGRRLPVVARLLQEADIDVIVAMEHKVTILHVAAGIGSVEMLDLVLKTYPNLINAKTTEGKTALDAAVWNNHGYAIIRLLQEADIDINEVDLSIKDKNGNNLVHLAAQGGVVGVLETLKKSAPNFNALLSEKNNDAKTPLDVAKDNDHQVFADALQGLIDANLVAKDPNVLDERIIKDLEESSFSKERIEYWLAKGLNINARDDKEFNGTLLMHVIADTNEAARTGHKDVVKYLLQQKDIDLSVKWYTDILQWAVANGYSGMVSVVLETRPEIDLDTYKDSNNLVHLAAQGGFVDVLAELEGRIAKYHLTEKNNDDKTPIEVAQENGHQPFVDALQKLIEKP